MRIRKRMDSAILFSVKGKNKYKLLKLECLFCTLFSHSAIIAGERKNVHYYIGILAKVGKIEEDKLYKIEVCRIIASENDIIKPEMEQAVWNTVITGEKRKCFK
uniref:hypothetical protein n=1 Tax=Lachnoclostridium phocaeense TaxID=1871021 RepID=UPI000976B19E|nr:hypothetical protein [Lachnoclostridium phocaeense]